MYHFYTFYPLWISSHIVIQNLWTDYIDKMWVCWYYVDFEVDELKEKRGDMDKSGIKSCENPDQMWINCWCGELVDKIKTKFGDYMDKMLIFVHNLSSFCLSNTKKPAPVYDRLSHQI